MQRGKVLIMLKTFLEIRFATPKENKETHLRLHFENHVIFGVIYRMSPSDLCALRVKIIEGGQVTVDLQPMSKPRQQRFTSLLHEARCWDL